MKRILFITICVSFLSLIGSKNELVFPKEFIADGFDWPVGKPDGNGYYSAQPFGENNHLGEDLNAKTGGNTDLGDPVYSVANGYVKFAEDVGGGWGNVIRILHKLEDGTIVESLYAHCDEIKASKGSFVSKGDKIGTIGDAHGQYYAHLHFEIRSDVSMSIGGGYSADQKGYLNPLNYVKSHR
jgi:murein DD-endopeptidase MepM/ murein hydrolase activator NlpD